MRTVSLVEAASAFLDLSAEEAAALQRLGVRLASRKEWWGGFDADAVERTVIRCRPAAGSQWKVRVSDAVGLISIGALQRVVESKIPTTHVLYLFGRCGAFPRLEDQRGTAAIGESLFELVATWFITATEHVLRRDLVRDCEGRRDDIPTVRGTEHKIETAGFYYRGRLEFACSFEEFGFDPPLNRALLAAVRVVAASPQLPWGTRRRALAIQARMEGVHEFDVSDPWPKLDRRTAHYRDALALAGHLLRSQHRDLQRGGADTWTFLIKTPDMIEAGLRVILRETFGDIVHKTARQLRNSLMTLNPDLVIGNDLAVADLKYKLTTGDWNRADLYQAVAFATGYRTPYAAVINFRASTERDLETICVGDVSVQRLSWPADPGLSAETALAQFLSTFRAWLEPICGQIAGDGVA